MIKLNIPNLTQKLANCKTLVTKYRLDKDNPWVHVYHITITKEDGTTPHYDMYIELPAGLLAEIAQYCEGNVVRGLVFLELDEEYAVLAYSKGYHPYHEGAHALDVYVGNISAELGELLDGGIVQGIVDGGY